MVFSSLISAPAFPAHINWPRSCVMRLEKSSGQTYTTVILFISSRQTRLRIFLNDKQRWPESIVFINIVTMPGYRDLLFKSTAHG